jgi:hypothetical protein
MHFPPLGIASARKPANVRALGLPVTYVEPQKWFSGDTSLSAWIPLQHPCRLLLRQATLREPICHSAALNRNLDLGQVVFGSQRLRAIT